MFSTLGQVFLNRPRQAESSDTHMYLQRHDPDQQRRRKKKNDQDPFLQETEDNASVTIEALRLFLSNFLKSLENNEDSKAENPQTAGQSQTGPLPEKAETQDPDRSNGAAARAASIYEHAAETSESHSFTVEHTPETVTHDKLKAEEIRSIHVLLEDLKDLKKRGIENLTIGRADSFLESLVNAVEKAKKAP